MAKERHLHKPSVLIPKTYFASVQKCLVCGATRAVSPFGIGPWYLENQRIPYCLRREVEPDGEGRE